MKHHSHAVAFREATGSSPGPPWFYSSPGPTWLDSSPGSPWLDSSPGPPWFDSSPGPPWLDSSPGPPWLDSSPGPPWLDSSPGPPKPVQSSHTPRTEGPLHQQSAVNSVTAFQAFLYCPHTNCTASPPLRLNVTATNSARRPKFISMLILFMCALRPNVLLL
jgi:hypothetical protein